MAAAFASLVTFSNPTSVLSLPHQRSSPKVFLSRTQSKARKNPLLRSQFHGLRFSHSPSQSLPVPSRSSPPPPKTQILATVKKGKAAPNFVLKNQHGKQVDLRSFRGKPCVVYFYPGNNKRGCKKEACAFRDKQAKFEKAGANVIGISSDSSKSHQKFATKHKLPYTLASDRGNKVRKQWGAGGSLLGTSSKRQTFVLDKNGVVKHVYKSRFRPKKHASEALKSVQKENKKSTPNPMNPFKPTDGKSTMKPMNPLKPKVPRGPAAAQSHGSGSGPLGPMNPFKPKGKTKPPKNPNPAPEPEGEGPSPKKPVIGMANPFSSKAKPSGSEKKNPLMPMNPLKPKKDDHHHGTSKTSGMGKKDDHHGTSKSSGMGKKDDHHGTSKSSGMAKKDDHHHGTSKSSGMAKKDDHHGTSKSSGKAKKNPLMPRNPFTSKTEADESSSSASSSWFSSSSSASSSSSSSASGSGSASGDSCSNNCECQEE